MNARSLDTRSGNDRCFHIRAGSQLESSRHTNILQGTAMCTIPWSVADSFLACRQPNARPIAKCTYQCWSAFSALHERRSRVIAVHLFCLWVDRYLVLHCPLIEHPGLNDTANPPDRLCPLEDICGFGGFHDKDPNQWFRFITPVFLHAGIIHILLNMLAQVTVSAEVSIVIWFYSNIDA